MNDIEQLKKEIIRCSASLLLNRLSEYHEDWPSKMTRKNMAVVRKHNEYLRSKAIQLRSFYDDLQQGVK